MKSNFDEERQKFELHLMETFGYSKKTAKDCASRCKRIEKYLLTDLSTAVSNAEKFEDLLINIQLYATSFCKTKESAYALTGVLRAASKKYALYLFPNQAKTYPTAYGKTRYT